jgi:hypothetical protein
MMPKTLLHILVGLLFFLPPTSAEAKLPKEKIYMLFSQANEAFRQANLERSDSAKADRLYEEAILAYEKIIDAGQTRNAGLYYNLANTYFLKGDLGKAILNYRRAQKLDVADANIQKNLAFARSQRLDKVSPKTEKRILQTLFFWHYDFSLKTKFVMTCIFFAACCIALTVMIWFGRSPIATTTGVITGLLTLCLLASVVMETRTQATTICGVITADEVIARQGDGQNYAPSFKEPLHTGTEFDLLESRTGWLHIKLADDTDSWIPDHSADLI